MNETMTKEQISDLEFIYIYDNLGFYFYKPLDIYEGKNKLFLTRRESNPRISFWLLIMDIHVRVLMYLALKLQKKIIQNVYNTLNL